MIGTTKTLHPAFKIVVDCILLDMRAKGWDAVIGSGMRTVQQQAALYAQGRQNLETVNKMRRAVGLGAISQAANRESVTDAKPGESNHNLTTFMRPSGQNRFLVEHGYAVDIVSKKYGWDIPDRQFWTDLGRLSKQYGCVWGGDWKRKDVAHVEMRISDGIPQDSVTV